MYISLPTKLSQHVWEIKKNRLKYINFKYFVYIFNFECAIIDIHFLHRDSFKTWTRFSSTRKRTIHARLHIWNQFPASLSLMKELAACPASWPIAFAAIKAWRLYSQYDRNRVIVPLTACRWRTPEVKPFNYPLTLRRLYLFNRSRRGRDIIYNVTHYALSFASFFSFFHFVLDVIQCVAGKQFFQFFFSLTP